MLFKVIYRNILSTNEQGMSEIGLERWEIVDTTDACEAVRHFHDDNRVVVSITPEEN